MKKLIISLTLLLAILLVSCGGGSGADTSAVWESSGVDTLSVGESSLTDAPDSETIEDHTPNYINLVADGSAARIIYPHKGGATLAKNASALSAAIADVTGVTLEVKSDSEAPSVEPHDTLEILIGECDRPITLAMYATPAVAVIKKTIGEGYAEIGWQPDNKFVFFGSDEIIVRYAIDIFIEDILTDPELAGEKYLNLAPDFNLRIEEKEMSPARLIDKANQKNVVLTHVVDVPTVGNHNVLQGSCTDGQHAYVVLENQSLNPTMSVIRKIDLATRKVVLDSKPIPIDHGNDLVYNPNTNMIIAVHNAPNRQKISFIDPKTLKVTETKTLTYSIFSMSYNPVTDRYVLGLSGGQNFIVTDSEFVALEKKPYLGINTGYVTQGVDSDDKYIYFLQYNLNCIVVFDWSGNHIKTVYLPEADHETESIFHIGPTIYISYYSGKRLGGSIYRMDIGD